MEGVRAGRFGGLRETKHMHICQSILTAISFKNVLKLIRTSVLRLVLVLELGFTVHSWVTVTVRVKV